MGLYHSKELVSSEPSTSANVTTTAEDASLLALVDCFSGATLDCHDVPVVISNSMDIFPNEILTLILNDPGIPLQERIKLRGVSSRWMAVIEDGLKKVTSLVLSYRPLKHRVVRKMPDDLVISNPKYFNNALVQLLAHLFPSVSDITFADDSWYSNTNFDQLPELLSKYSTTLKSFSLIGEPSTLICTKLADAINSLANLSSFKLNSEHRFKCILLSDLSSTLARLEHFEMYDFYKGMEYSSNTRSLVRLVDGSIDLLSDRCTHLKLDVKNLNCITNISQKMPSLTSLTLNRIDLFNWEYFNSALLRSLSRLQKLTELRLTPLGCATNSFKPPLETNDQPLSGVKRLYLDLAHIVKVEAHFCNPEDIYGQDLCSTLAAWFPNLKQLTIKCNPKYHNAFNLNLKQFPNSTTISIVNSIEQPYYHQYDY